MDDGQLGFFDSGDGTGPRHPQEATDEELEARRRARHLPVDQAALNLIGVAQARIELAAGRAATFRVGRSCRSCGSDIATVRPSGQHLSAWCAVCRAFSYHLPRTEVGLATRPVSDVRPRLPARRRAQILARDNGRCVLCGRSAAEDVQLTVGHLVSVKDGQRLDVDEALIWDDLNLAAMCDTCQLGLNDQSVPVVVFLALALLRAQRARRDDRWPAG
jgi:5-methylcytosine-specific restriction endonuclease McrA